MDVLVYNNGYDPVTGVGEIIDLVTTKHARTMVHRGVAEIVAPRRVPSWDRNVVPIALELVRRIYPSWTEFRREGSIGFSTLGIHERDHWRCAYCGNKTSKTPKRAGLIATVDHVHPASLGGPTNWSNLVTACYDCNQRKMDRSVADSGMTLRFEPYDPTTSYRDSDGGIYSVATGRRQELAYA